MTALFVCAAVVSASAQALRVQAVVNTATGTAQESEETIELPPGVVLPPGVKLPKRHRAKASETNAVAEAKSPEEQRLQELLELKFSRSAPAILDALAEQFDDQKTASTNEVERFEQLVVVGDWAEVGKYLRSLDEVPFAALPTTNDYGKQVYRHLLKELSSTSRRGRSRDGPQPDEPTTPPQGQPGPAKNAAPPLALADVLALAEIAPHPLEDEDALLLGQLLKRLLSRGDALEPFLAKLRDGVRGLGGKDPADRHRAAELLVAADCLIEAGEFLPTVADAEEKDDFTALDLHARQLMAVGKKEKDSKAFTRAWEVNQFILASTNSAASNREPALKRSFELMPLIADKTGTNWLRQNFSESPKQGLVILAAVSQLVQSGMGDRDAKVRQKNLELQKQVVEAFLGVADPAQPQWRAALNLLAQGWTAEAAYAKQRFRTPRNYGPQYDEFGNMTRFESFQPQRSDGNGLPPIGVEPAADCAPGDVWLAQLDESLRLAVIALVADLYVKADQCDKALPQIEALAKKQPVAASELANDFLKTWAKARNPGQPRRNMAYGPYGPIYYGPGSPYGMRGPGISLTRAMQQRNIRELAEIMRRLEALNLPKLEDDVLVEAFSASHSPAEVFRVEDMETVFGSPDRIKLDTLAGLAQTMRERLAGQWRSPRTQQEAKTQRTDKQIDAEVLRGYEVVLKLVDDGLKRDANNWALTLARAAAYFDLAEFQYGKKVDLAIYVEKREEAFNGFARAAALYADALPGIAEKDQSPKVYQQWFNANLGASDLAYVTRQQEPETNQLQRIRDAILALPGGAAERHMAAFAKQLGKSANSIKPELKPRYLRAGLRVVGDHEDAEEARKIVTYYDDLLREIEFVVRLDGDAEVGHAAPFGIFASLRHTADIERESGGFARYLRNQKKSAYGFYYNPYGHQQRNFVEDFEKQVREKLTDKFDIKAVTFLDEKVQSRGYGRAGWRETPLAYILVQAKDGSVDRIPTLQMDLDFVDARGAVVLPVESQIILLDARPEHVAARPLNDVELTQILDDREIGAGRLALEIKATGKGLVPDLGALLKTNFANLRVEEFSDQGLAVSQIDTEGDEVAPVSERGWLVKLQVAEDAPSSLTFHFPESVLPGAKMTYKRYADADLAEVKSEVALAGLTLRARPWWHWLVLGVILLAAGAGVVWWLRRHKPASAKERPLYVLPEPATPFTVIGLLRRMHADASLRWSETDRAELAQTVQRLEGYFFARDRNGDPEPDLAGIGRRWVTLAGNGK